MSDWWFGDPVPDATEPGDDSRRPPDLAKCLEAGVNPCYEYLAPGEPRPEPSRTPEEAHKAWLDYFAEMRKWNRVSSPEKT
jgi:hypothetical protein